MDVCGSDEDGRGAVETTRVVREVAPAVLSSLVRPPFDACIPEIVELMMDDLFGESASAKEAKEVGDVSLVGSVTCIVHAAAASPEHRLPCFLGGLGGGGGGLFCFCLSSFEFGDVALPLGQRVDTGCREKSAARGDGVSCGAAPITFWASLP